MTYFPELMQVKDWIKQVTIETVSKPETTEKPIETPSTTGENSEKPIETTSTTGENNEKQIQATSTTGEVTTTKGIYQGFTLRNLCTRYARYRRRLELKVFVMLCRRGTQQVQN